MGWFSEYHTINSDKFNDFRSILGGVGVGVGGKMPRAVICLTGSCDGVGIVMPEGGHLPGGEL